MKSNRTRFTVFQIAVFTTVILRSLGSSAEEELRANGPRLDLTTYEVTFVEDFSRPNIVAKAPFSQHAPGMRWLAHTPWNGDFGEARFADPGPGGPFSFGVDGLTITASKQENGKWKSGLICSVDRDGNDQQGFVQKYGYFEMRAKLPNGPGVWPAFWLVGKDKSSGSAEIDVLEYYGKFPSGFHTVLHYWAGSKSFHKGFVTAVEKDHLTSDFHDFGVLIDENKIRFYLDHIQYLELATPDEFKQPMYILANLALGGGWPIEGLETPSVLHIKHIKVFQNISKSK